MRLLGKCYVYVGNEYGDLPPVRVGSRCTVVAQSAGLIGLSFFPLTHEHMHDLDVSDINHVRVWGRLPLGTKSGWWVTGHELATAFKPVLTSTVAPVKDCSPWP